MRVLPYQVTDSLRYKQVNVLWGDQNHKTVCLVRSDVTDIVLHFVRLARQILHPVIPVDLHHGNEAF